MLIFEVLTWMVAGALVGVAARKAFPNQTRNREPVMTALIGAVLGGYGGVLAVGPRAGEYRGVVLLFAASGAAMALIALWVYRGWQRPSHRDV